MREQRLKQTENKKQTKKESIQRLWDNYKTYKIHTMGIPEGEEKKEQKKKFETIMIENFLQINVRP